MKLVEGIRDYETSTPVGLANYREGRIYWCIMQIFTILPLQLYWRSVTTTQDILDPLCAFLDTTEWSGVNNL
jgi:hypothetical protein